MASWNAVRIELDKRPKLPNGNIDFDKFRREKYVAVEKITGRPLIVYATDFLNKGKVSACQGDVEIGLTDREGFLEVTQGLTDKVTAEDGLYALARRAVPTEVARASSAPRRP